jgi:hypothetical protein
MSSKTYSSTHVLAPIWVRRQIVAWARDHIDPRDLAFDVEDEPLETESHVTILYGLHTRKVKDVVRLVHGFGTVTYRLGAMSLFEKPECDVLKINVKSYDLRRLNELLRELPFTNSYEKYRPHMTIGYLKPGTGAKYAGSAVFSGMTLTANSFVFSPADGKKTKVTLTGATVLLSRRQSHSSLTEDESPYRMSSPRVGHTISSPFVGHDANPGATAFNVGAGDRDTMVPNATDFGSHVPRTRTWGPGTKRMPRKAKRNEVIENSVG